MTGSRKGGARAVMAAGLMALLAACAQNGQRAANNGPYYNRPDSATPPGPPGDPWGPWPWRMECRADGTTLLVSKNEIAKPERGSGTGWTAKSDDHHWLHWLAADKQIAYVLGYKVDEKGEFTGYESPPRVRRLDLKTGAWLPDLPLPANALPGHPAWRRGQRACGEREDGGPHVPEGGFPRRRQRRPSTPTECAVSRRGRRSPFGRKCFGRTQRARIRVAMFGASRRRSMPAPRSDTSAGAATSFSSVPRRCSRSSV